MLAALIQSIINIEILVSLSSIHSHSCKDEDRKAHRRSRDGCQYASGGVTVARWGPRRSGAARAAGKKCGPGGWDLEDGHREVLRTDQIGAGG